MLLLLRLILVTACVFCTNDVHNGSAFTFIAPSSQQWELDMLGNWKKVKHSPIYDGTGWTSENRTHNRANEMTTRDPDGPGGATNPPLDLTFDDVGNITAQDTSPSTTVDYVHDAWNRLVRIEQSSAVRGAYTYNGLNWRITRRADMRGTNANDPINPPDGTIDEVRYLTYSGGWQLLQEDVDVGENASIDRRIQYVWGIRGVDDLILRREDGAPPTGTTGGGSGTDGTYERQRIYLTDPIGSPVAILDNANAAVIERISYDAYGNARHHSPADLDGDGDVDGMDQAILLGAWADDVADTADIDRDGNVDGWDLSLLLYYWGGAMPAGWITYPGEDNNFGFAAYVHNKEAPGAAGGAYLARYRWYDPLLGRWLSRDPAGYVDGLNLYLYVAANPLVLIDPLGLLAEPCANPYIAGFRAYWSSIYENTAKPVVDAAADYAEFGYAVATDDFLGAMETDHGQRAMEAMVTADSPLEAAVNYNVNYVKDAVTGTVKSAVETAKGIAEGDIDAIGEGLRTAGALGLGGAGMLQKGSQAARAAAAANRKVPNPHGKLGGPAHQAKVQEVLDDVSSRGLRAEREVPIRTVNGQRQRRVMDVVARDSSGKIVEVHQVGRALKSNPRIPVARERAALRDIRHSPDVHGAARRFHTYQLPPEPF
jgi:RHS repeat-associated protein